MQVIRLTIRESAEAIQRRCGGHVVPDWKMRRVVDALESTERLDVQRVGMYRTIAADDITVIVEELRRIAWLPSVESCA
jgi:hypothetical protein